MIYLLQKIDCSEFVRKVFRQPHCSCFNDFRNLYNSESQNIFSKFWPVYLGIRTYAADLLHSKKYYKSSSNSINSIIWNY